MKNIFLFFQEVYDQQKELILLGERLVLATLGFDMNVQHPYRSLVDAVLKFKVAKNALVKVAWNFLNDGYYASFIYWLRLGLFITLQ